MKEESDTRLLALMVRTPDEPGMPHALTKVIFDHQANITYVDIAERREDGSTTYFELENVAAPDELIGDLESLPIVWAVVEQAPSFQKVYSKRIIVVGGGAQVGQVVVGAVAEQTGTTSAARRSDRHDTAGWRGGAGRGDARHARLPRAVALVLAGALMGGEVARAVYEIREKGIIVLSLNMPGSVSTPPTWW